MHLSLNLSLNGIMTDVNKCIIVPFKVIKTSFQSIFTTSHNSFLSSIIWAGVSCPTILNEWMLPVVLHNLTRTYCLTSEKNSNTLTVLENSFPLNILHFLVVTRMKIIRPIIIDANAAIVHHCTVHLQCSFSLPNIASVSPIGWKSMPVSKAFIFACLHVMHTIAAVAIMDRMVVINRKTSIM